MSFRQKDCRISLYSLRDEFSSSLHPIYHPPAESVTANYPLIMGIVNITPDSFYDGNQYNSVNQAIDRANEMVEAGVDIIDIGGESTRPGATAVGQNEEIDRVIPIIEQFSKINVHVSIDTSKAEVMKAAVRSGAHMINDVRALQDLEALNMAAELQVPVCLMHMQGEPRCMQSKPKYHNVVEDVLEFMRQRIKACETAGIKRELLCIDPGFGFGKTLAHNLELLNNLEKFSSLDLPVLAGLSRKSMLGAITSRPVDQRLASSLAVALIAMQKGARIIRVHDVAETSDVRQIFMALEKIAGHDN